MRVDVQHHRIPGAPRGRTTDARTDLTAVRNDRFDRSTEMLLLHEALARARMREMREPRVSRGAREPARQVAAAAARRRDRL